MEYKKMICPNCGADIAYTRDDEDITCEYCGGVFSTNNETEKEVKTKYITRVEYIKEPEKPKKKRTLLWIAGWIFCFPIPLTIIIWRSKLSKKWKGILTAALWIFVIAWGKVRNSGSDSTVSTRVSETDQAVSDQTDSTESLSRSTTEGVAEVTTENVSIEKTVISQFDSSKNYLITNGNYEYEVPAYLGEGSLEDGVYTNSRENDLFIYSWVGDSSKDLSSCTEEELRQLLYFTDYEYTEENYEASEYPQIAGSRLLSSTGQIEEDSVTVDISISAYIDYENNRIFLLSVIINPQSKYDYSSDIDQIINSVRPSSNVGSSGSSSDFYEMLDSYEAFMDEYIDIVNKYSSNPTDTELMSDYFSFMTKYAEWLEKIDNLDDSEMTDDELLYYNEVTARVTAKLLKAGLSQ